MEKCIKLKMAQDKSIHIFVEDKKKYVMKSENRTINAEDIYNILHYSRGDKFTVNAENIENIDQPVLNFFKDLIEDIVKELNILSADSKGTIVNAEPN